MSAPAAHKPGAPHAEHKGTHATPSLASTHTQGGHKHQHHHTKVKFARSRHEFRRLAAHAGLIFSDFSTSRDNVKHASSHRNGLTSSNESSYVSLGLSFSAVQNGLPFDFALQPGLVHVATRRRRLAEDMRERAVDSPLLPPPPVPTTAALAPSPRPWSASPASASDGWPSLSPPQPGQLFAAANSAWAEWARRWMDRMEQWAAPSLDAHAPADLIAVEAGDAEEEEEVVEEARFSKGRSLGQRSLRSRTRVMVRRRRRNPLHHLAHDGIDPQPQAQQQAHQQLVQQQVHQPRALGGSMERGPRRNRRLLREISKESESHGPSGTAAAASTKAAGGGGADSAIHAAASHPHGGAAHAGAAHTRTGTAGGGGGGGGHAAGAHAAGAHAAGAHAAGVHAAGVHAAGGAGSGGGGSSSRSHHASTPRDDQIRFAAPRSSKLTSAAAASPSSLPPKAAAAATSASGGENAIGEGNGGEDFTFTFPRAETDLYRIFAFGFEVLDDTDTANETLSIFDTHSQLIGVLDLGADVPSVASRPTAAAMADVISSTASFYGFVSSVPIGYASFDENPAGDSIGLAGFVFGYKEHEQSVYPPHAWLVFSGGVALLLLIERRPLRAAGSMDVKSATLWLFLCTVVAALLGLVLWLLRSWRQATLYTACFTLNGMLSGDNLVVFMLLLQQAGLDHIHHVTAISLGMLLALAVRILLSLAGSLLLQNFSWVLLLFAGFLLITGLKMLFFDSPVDLPGSAVNGTGTDHAGKAGAGGGGGNGGAGHRDNGVDVHPAEEEEEEGLSSAGGQRNGKGGADWGNDDDESGHGGHVLKRTGEDLLAVRCIGACVPLHWSDTTGGKLLARDPTGRLSATRMTVCVVGIALADVLFAMDSVPVLLSLTTSPFVLVSSQTLSLLWLRPVYFLLAALASYLDSMQQALAVVLVLISVKIFLEAAGFEVPVAAFLGVVVGWRALVVMIALFRNRKPRASMTATPTPTS